MVFGKASNPDAATPRVRRDNPAVRRIGTKADFQQAKTADRKSQFLQIVAKPERALAEETQANRS